MRPAARLLATLPRNPSAYLEAGTPTGLTGVLTHATPRPTLLYLYSTTLDALSALPEHSIYRRSTEALTKHRMRIVESIKPAGLAEWQDRVSPLVDAHPDAFKKIKSIESNGGYNIIYREPPPEQAFRSDDDRINAPYKAKPQLEGPRMEEEVADRGAALARDLIGERASRLEIEAEPALTVEQVAEMEKLIGAGLIEEVIAVAEGERELVGVMGGDKVWEDLVEKAPADQWIYNERKNM